MDDARAAFAASRGDIVVISDPEGFSTANGTAFPRKFGGCIDAFIQAGARQPRCVKQVRRESADYGMYEPPLTCST
ncbi:MAG: hypothetical protein JSR91_15180 [Proteobacteria bacterium]|nr:hypothetical protein [Pseudomonadota bacterium]